MQSVSRQLDIEQQGAARHAHDLAKPDSEALSLEQLEKYVLECRMQPDWRYQCDIDADYYDGKQLDNQSLSEMRDRGFPPLIENLVRPTIDAVLGIEAKSRTDWVVKPDTDPWIDVAEALSVKLKEAERESMADRACADGFAGQIKTGLHWVEVSRETNPFKYPYRVRPVHRREIAWDWVAKEPDYGDMRYLIRRRWFDVDNVIASFPQHRELLKSVVNGWDSTWQEIMRGHDTGLEDAYAVSLRTSIDDMEYRDPDRQRVCIYEIWYRVWHRGAVMKLPDGRVVEVDTGNFEHSRAIALGLIKPQIAVFDKVRRAFWAGPYRLEDTPSPYKHRRFPYVPLFGYREDRSGRPYGLIRSMRNQQDEVNARKAKMMWLLSSKRVIADEDVVDDHDMVKEEVGRPDAYIILSKSRQRDSKFDVDTEMMLGDQQFKVYEQARKSLQDVAGVYQALLGQRGAADSGVAISQLIEQSTTTLAEIIDNFRFARKQIGETLLDLIKEDVAEKDVVQIGDGPARRDVTLNEPADDELGQYIKNDVAKARAKVVLEDIPSTPTYRAQQLAQLTEFTKSLPPQMQALVIDFVVEATDLPQRKKIAERIRKATGIESGQPKSPEEQAQFEAEKKAKQEAEAIQKKGIELEMGEREAKINKLNAEAQEIATRNQPGPEFSPQELEQMKAAALAERQKVFELQAEINQLNVALKNREQEIATGAQTEVEKAHIEAAATVRAAELQAESNRIVARMDMKIAELDQALKQGQQDSLKRDQEREQKAADREKADKEIAMAKEKAESDAQKKVDEAEAAAAAAAQPIVLNVNVDAKGATKKTATIKKNPDGSYSMDSMDAESAKQPLGEIP